MIIRDIVIAQEPEIALSGFPGRSTGMIPIGFRRCILERKRIPESRRKTRFSNMPMLALFMVEDEAGRDLGRIAAVVNFNHIRTHT